MEVLRFITCGSVDDGKSTLIGRMLYDTNAVQVDLLKAVEASSRHGHNNGNGSLDLSLLTDGLKSEREQGITIDVAYKYFSTEKRKFIIADTPGHVQYTRNMVTGASNAQLAILLIDARNGIVEQTWRHTYIVSLLRLPHLVLAINKMDLVDYSLDRYEEIRRDFLQLMDSLHYEAEEIEVIPMNALQGDNVVHSSKKMPWYQGPALLSHLETVEIEYDENLDQLRFPVQGVIRPRSPEFHDYRGYSGQVAGGIFCVGQTVQLLPSNTQSRIAKIEFSGKEIQEAFPPMSVTICLEDDLDLSRGDLITDQEEGPRLTQECIAELCWMDTEALLPKKTKYIMQHLHRQITVMITEIIHVVNIRNLDRQSTTSADQLGLNDIGCIRIKAQQPLYFDPYIKNKRTGSFILIDPGSFSTVAAGMFVE